jgi:thiol-disulfide isomerase/thioredoxin
MKSTFVYALALIFVGCFGKEPENTGLEGKSLPSFKLFLEDSTTYFDTKDIPSGKPVVLFLFGPHCPYSKSQVEEIVNNMQSLKDIQFYFFTTWSFRELKQFYKMYDLKQHPNIVAGVDYTNFFADHFSAEGVPYIAIYGKDKKLKKAFIGKIKSSQIQSVAIN